MTTAIQTTPQPEPETKAAMSDRARDKISHARERVGTATHASVDAAKKHPGTATAIAAGTAAAVGGIVFGAMKYLGGRGTGGTTKRSARSAKKN